MKYTYCSFVLTVVNLISTIYLAISCYTYFPHQKVFRAGQIFQLTKVLNSVLQIGIFQNYQPFKVSYKLLFARFHHNKSLMPLDLNIMLGHFKFTLQATVDHHGQSMNCGHYTASINCCGKTFYCNNNKITECTVRDTYNSSTV